MLCFFFGLHISSLVQNYAATFHKFFHIFEFEGVSWAYAKGGFDLIKYFFATDRLVGIFQLRYTVEDIFDDLDFFRQQFERRRRPLLRCLSADAQAAAISAARRQQVHAAHLPAAQPLEDSAML